MLFFYKHMGTPLFILGAINKTPGTAVRSRFFAAVW